jgi:hypothetical protein
MKTIISALSSIMLCVVLTTANGQSSLKPYNNLAMGDTYQTAIGLRAGETSGLTFKKFMTESTALEGIFGLWNHGMSVTVLYEKYLPAFNVSGLNWYFGGGGHLAIKHRHYFSYYDRGRYYYYQYSRVGLGIDGVAGMEYKIPKTPLAINLELKPYIEVISEGGIWSSLDPGFGLKLTF